MYEVWTQGPKITDRLRVIDPDFYVYKSYLIDAIADNIIRQADLDSWVRITNVISMPLSSVGYLDLCEFWRAAIIKATNGFIKEQNDAQKETLKNLENKISKDTHTGSPFDRLPKPNLSSYS